MFGGFVRQVARVPKGAHPINIVPKRILLVDGDQFVVSNKSRTTIGTHFGSIHVFRNPVSKQNQQLQHRDVDWCEYHVTPSCEKEAVDHNITFFCGQNSQVWLENNQSVTIVSRDKGFRNTQWLLNLVGVDCELIPRLNSK